MKSYTRYICTSRHGEPIGVDDSSGGYPYVPKWNGEPSFSSVKMYWTAEAAQDYADVFKNSQYRQLNVKKIIITIEDV